MNYEHIWYLAHERLSAIKIVFCLDLTCHFVIVIYNGIPSLKKEIWGLTWPTYILVSHKVHFWIPWGLEYQTRLVFECVWYSNAQYLSPNHKSVIWMFVTHILPVNLYTISVGISSNLPVNFGQISLKSFGKSYVMFLTHSCGDFDSWVFIGF